MVKNIKNNMIMKPACQSFLFIAFLITLGSCQKDEGVPEITDFNVNTEYTEYKVREKVVFNINGNADFISFYSGEIGKDYAHKDGRRIKIDSIKMSFNNAVISGSQSAQLSVLLSTDFNGKYDDFLNVQSAIWKEITGDFTLSQNSFFINSGLVNITHFRLFDKPLYVAFKYLTKPQVTYGEGRSWRIEKFQLNAETEAGIFPLSSGFINDGFRIVDQNPSTAPARSNITASRITLQGNNYDAYNDPQTENWAISKAFDVNNVDVGMSLSMPVKGIVEAARNTYEYTYTQPGIYIVTFVATNASIYDSKSIIRQIEIKVVP